MPTPEGLFEASDVIALIKTTRARGEVVDTITVPVDLIKGPKPMDLDTFVKRISLISDAAESLGVQSFVSVEGTGPRATTRTTLDAEDAAKAQSAGSSLKR